MKMKGDDLFEETQVVSENLEHLEDFDQKNMESTSVEKQASESETFFWNVFSKEIEKLMQLTNELSEPIIKINAKMF